MGTVVKILGIETATGAVGAALTIDRSTGIERLRMGGRAHAELLVPLIEEVCSVSGCAVAQLDHVAVDVGPGLFTGLRVGVATAKALAQALGIGASPVASLDALAASAARRLGTAEQATRVPVVALVDARRGEVFASAYRFDRVVPATAGRIGSVVDPASVREDRPEPLDPDRLLDWLAGLVTGSDRVVVVGDGAVRYRTVLEPRGKLDLGLAAEVSAPSPLMVAELAERRLAGGAKALSAEQLVCDYRRSADARMNWERRMPEVAVSDEDLSAR
ncbi:MAG: tRNA (adenosine(37)-N6)-threonylcarbamoyltransferase complex dimerization subunit type 1 TsaB [Acidimicrobiales bacterium]